MPTDMTINLIWAALLGYLIGSIPFGLLLTKAAGMGDVRQIGSGNIGATNVLRTGNKGLAAGTLVLDQAQGLVVGHGLPVGLGIACSSIVVIDAGDAEKDIEGFLKKQGESK